MRGELAQEIKSKAVSREWHVFDPDIKTSRFWCFDEAFTTFLSAPPPPYCLHYMSLKSEESDAEIEGWLMSKELGDDWCKEYVIKVLIGRWCRRMEDLLGACTPTMPLDVRPSRWI